MTIRLFENVASRALQLHNDAFFVDAHTDAVLDVLGRDIRRTGKKRFLGERSTEGHVDFPRLAEGGVDLEFFALWIEPEFKLERSTKRALELFDALVSQIQENKQRIELVLSFADIERIHSQGKICALASVEGGEAIEGSLPVLRMFHRLGIRAMGLTWNERNQLADGAGESRTQGGLTNIGVETVREMNRLGMVVDVSHLSEAGFRDVLEVSTKPVIASHSNCRALTSHRRNLTDDQIRGLAQNGGVMGIVFAEDFLTSDPAKEPASINNVIDHLEYAVKIGGVDHVGIGSDFDGIEKAPKGLEDSSKFPNITIELVKRGYREEEIFKILGGNFLRVLKETLPP
jgi:membrane dipeptidase